ALDIQEHYLTRAQKFVQDRYGADVDDMTLDVLTRWESVLNRLRVDPMSCSDQLDWVAKLRLLNAYRTRDKLTWSSPRLQLVDLQYSDVRPEKGLYHRLVARGQMKTVVDTDEVTAAITAPPEDTRAYFRGRCLEKFGSSVVGASWDSLIFDVNRESLVRIPMLEPLRGSKAHVGDLIDSCDTAAELLSHLTSR
ncbi:MAG: proteasome accessory factor PafA2 family protein, partial [Mycobacteriales bacterium]